MTHVTIPNRPTPKDNRDINALLANFDAITNVINGQLSNDNFENEGIGLAKIEKGFFLELLVGGEHRKLAFGVHVPSGGFDVTAGRSRYEHEIAHGLGKTPLAVHVTSEPLAIQENGGAPQEAVACSVNGLGPVNFKLVATALGTSNNGTDFFWLAIG